MIQKTPHADNPLFTYNVGEARRPDVSRWLYRRNQTFIEAVLPQGWQESNKCNAGGMQARAGLNSTVLRRTCVNVCVCVLPSSGLRPVSRRSDTRMAQNYSVIPQRDATIGQEGVCYLVAACGLDTDLQVARG